MSRKAQVERKTGETIVELSLQLDGDGSSNVQTGVGFLDHMLTLWSKHSLIDLSCKAQGDLHVDSHHTVEDVGICLGMALALAVGDKAGIRRYGHAIIPMDECLVTAAVDLSGRACFVWQAEIESEQLGTFHSSLGEEFWRAATNHLACNLHMLCHYGRNTHHKLECIFKAIARAMRAAVEKDPRVTGVPSTKGIL